MFEVGTILDTAMMKSMVSEDISGGKFRRDMHRFSDFFSTGTNELCPMSVSGD